MFVRVAEELFARSNGSQGGFAEDSTRHWFHSRRQLEGSEKVRRG